MHALCQKPQSCPSADLSRVQVANGHTEHTVILCNEALDMLMEHRFFPLGVMRYLIFQGGPARSCQQIPAMWNPCHNEKNNVEAAPTLAALKISHTHGDRRLTCWYYCMIFFLQYSKEMGASFLEDASTQKGDKNVLRSVRQEAMVLLIQGTPNFRSYHLCSHGRVMLLKEQKWLVQVNLLPCESVCQAVKWDSAAAAISQAEPEWDLTGTAHQSPDY